MTGNEYSKLVEFDRNLAVGQEHWFRFTNNNRFRRVRVRIVKLNAKSIIGEGLEAYDTDLGGYPVGFRYKVPRIDDIRGWSVNNCVEHPDVTAFLEKRGNIDPDAMQEGFERSRD